MPTAESELEASLDRVLRQQDLNHDSLQAYLRGSIHPATTVSTPGGQTVPGRESESGFVSLASDSGPAGSLSNGLESTSCVPTSGVDNHQQQQPQSRRDFTSTSSYASSSSPSSSSVFAPTPPAWGAPGGSGDPDLDGHFFPGSLARPDSVFYRPRHEEEGEVGITASRNYGVLGE